jgi:large repetitive protein
LNPRKLAKVLVIIAFVTHIVVSATALTRDEFIAQQQQEALRLRSGILADSSATAALKLLAVDADAWTQSYFSALETAGLLRPVDAVPVIRTRTLVASMLSTLATGVLLGNAGQKLVSTGDLVGFFANVRKWYGEDTKLAINPELGAQVVNLPAPNAQQLDLHATSPTHTQGISIYVPFMYSQVDKAYGSVAANSFGNFFQAAGKVGTEASIIGPENFTNTDTPQTYTIGLQQQVSTKASEIRILTQLDPDLDSRTFQLGDLYLGDLQVHVPKERYAFDGDFDFVKTKGYVLHVSAGIDGATNTATWLVQAIDPNTGELVEGAFSGLLGDKGNGRVSYQIQAKQSLTTGTEISTQARVFFNNAAPVDTQMITTIIDAVAPTSQVTAKPLVAGSSDYLVKWTVTDDPNGAGVKGTSVYVSDNGGEFKVWQSQSTATEGVFKGIAGHSYEFLSLALDNAGNIENQQLKLRDLRSRLNNNTGEITVTGGGTPPVVVDLPTNSLFTQAQLSIPARVGNNPSGFQAVVKPFVASSLVKDLLVSNGGVGGLAVLPVADGKVLVSGGTNRSDLYLVDKLGNKQLIANLGTPIFDLAQDKNGTIWASTGGNQLLQLDPQTGKTIGTYGSDLTQTLAINPTTGKIYISSGDGIEIFDPATQTFKHFSNRRVDSLAFNPDGSLWATSWPERGDILKFSVTGIPEVVLHTDKALDSLAFGKLGSKLSNLLFVSSNNGELFAVDLKTKGIVKIASGGLRGEHLATTEDGKIYLAQGSHLDVLNPLLPPKVITTNPPNDGTVNLPNGQITIAFDSDMFVGTGVNSALDPKNYNLVSTNNGKIKIDSITYDATTRTATLNIGAIKSDVYQLTLASNLQNLEGEILGEYQTKFTALNDLSTSIDLNFSNARLDRQFNTVAYDVSIRNHTDADLTLPAYLLLEPNLGVTGKPIDATNQDGNYLIDLSSGLTNGILKAGQTINSRTIIVKDPDKIRVDFGTSVYAMALPNQAPVVNSTAITQAKVGQLYQYQVNATDVDSAPGSNLGYLLLAAPTGMVINSTTGLISWTPTASNNIKSAVTLRVYDSRGGSSDTKFNINVAGGNNAPTFVNQPTQLNGREGTKLELKINAQDLDKNSLE